MSRSRNSRRPVLRAATYLVPSLPVEYFEGVLKYLELRMGCETTLRYESRWEGPPKERRDPFGEDELDLAFVTGSAYLRLLETNTNIELLPVSSVHVHPRAEDRPGHFVDVIVNRNLKETVKEFIDLRGCRWAQNTTDYLGGSIITLHNLKMLGESANFFSNILKSNSHLDSIKMILSRKAHAAAVDSNALALYVKSHPTDKDELAVLTSWGPLPPYALVARKNLSEEVKERIVDTLLNMNYDQEGARILSEFQVRRFAAISPKNFSIERDLVESTKTMRFDAVYY